MSKSTLGTAISIANSAFGSAMIIFPLNYLKYGIIQNLIFLAIMSVLMSLTCSVYGMHLRPSEKQITQIVRRILGQRFFKVATLLSGILVMLVSSVFYLLASDILYDVLQDLDKNLFPNQKLFKCILLLFFAILTLPKNLSIVFKVSPFAMGALIISTLILIGSFPLNISNLDSGVIALKQFNFKNLILIASINSFALTCHPSISPILKENANQGENKKAIFLGFAITAIMYIFVGIGGSLAVYGKHPKKNANIMDYFQGEWQSPVIGFLNFFYFFCIIPIFPFVAKTQLISVLPQKLNKDPKIFTKATIIFVIVWLIINFLFVILETDASLVMGFLGSVVAYFFTYLIPILIIWKSGKTVFIKISGQKHLSSEEENEIIYTTNIKKRIQVSLITQDDQDIDANDEKSNVMITDNSQPNIFKDQGYIIKSYPISMREKIIYGAMLAFGSSMLLFEVISIIQGFFK